MDNKVLYVESSKHTYPIIVEPESLSSLYSKIEEHSDSKASRFFIITDDTVAPLYLDIAVSSFPIKDKVDTYVIPTGEASKSLSMYEKVMTAALENKLDRKSLIIALGGGVVGDLAGFIAATYMRGIPFVQVPTTLLAHDSSVGGKVGINHPLGKNMIGAFHPPSLVIYDPKALMSLPEKEWRSGFAEVIKHGFIADESFLTWLQDKIVSFQNISMDVLTELLIRSIKVKVAVVEQDEEEKGIRAYLNFGHTLGHAIEGEAGYGQLTHGEAVAIGMEFAVRFSEKYYGHQLEADKYFNYMKDLGYSLDIPSDMDINQLIHRIKLDKKSHSSKIHFVLLQKIGSPKLVEVNENLLKAELTGKGGV
ncbi:MULTISPECIES: 3-dehydroquinate synthase [Bacillaceae]|uniref:3-dehydroquinate synthase n=1 Tax=Evansella alkalicola TaxID=745819 RepID=A0ABS6JZB8_9BACI|nr:MULTISPECIES: 3-dehydroquinate synthase [Bacillaceae]MBU9723947.1 3-dehydroquinate synthase [Bacillus alkalicola]